MKLVSRHLQQLVFDSFFITTLQLVWKSEMLKIYSNRNHFIHFATAYLSIISAHNKSIQFSTVTIFKNLCINNSANKCWSVITFYVQIIVNYYGHKQFHSIIKSAQKKNLKELKILPFIILLIIDGWF